VKPGERRETAVAEDKEIKYRDDSGEEVTEKVSASELDNRMAESDAVYGVEGDDNRRAAYLAQGSDDEPDKPVTGERGA
jgi:hypothetical protein